MQDQILAQKVSVLVVEVLRPDTQTTLPGDLLVVPTGRTKLNGKGDRRVQEAW